MQNSFEKSEMLPPSYTSCVSDNVVVPSSAAGFNQLTQFTRIVGNNEIFHFYAPDGMGFVNVPQSVQVRDSSDNRILSIIVGRAQQVAREIISSSGESLISISTGNATLSAGDQILGVLEEGGLICRQTMKGKNAMGDQIFSAAGNISVGDSGCNCCLECGFGCCWPNSSEITFYHNGTKLGQLKRSTNSSGNELVLFNSSEMDPRTKAILIYASYSAYLSFFADTKCGRIGERGAWRRLCCVLLVCTLLLMSIPLFRL